MSTKYVHSVSDGLASPSSSDGFKNGMCILILASF